MAEPELKSVAAEASIDVTRARVEANIAASRKGRESSNFEEHVQREATARAASNQPVSANRGISEVIETTGKSSKAQAFEDALPGTTYDIATRGKLGARIEVPTTPIQGVVPKFGRMGVTG
ncbi:hypothetical protein PEC18_03405 [Paucibacter sp. O1-1]|nr:hypothetical protein [Paucibacter sp. O1-1]MDA3824924.1 hypothetical protein [Paucibacter sp. O1-1]